MFHNDAASTVMALGMCNCSSPHRQRRSNIGPCQVCGQLSERLLPSGKQEWYVCEGQQTFQQSVSPPTVVVAAIKKHATLIPREIGDFAMVIMLDSGSSLSLVRQLMVPRMSNVTNVKLLASQPSLVTASGDPLPIRGYIRAQVK